MGDASTLPGFINAEGAAVPVARNKGRGRERKRKSRRGHGVAVTVMVTLTGGSSVVSGDAESGSARNGRAPGDAGWGSGHRGGWLSPWFAPWGPLPAAAAAGASASPGAGAAPSSVLVAVSASSGVPMGSWAPGPALVEVGGGTGRRVGGLTGTGVRQPWREGVWSLTCGRAGRAALGTDRRTRDVGGRGPAVAPPRSQTPALTWEGVPVVGDPAHGQE